MKTFLKCFLITCFVGFVLRCPAVSIRIDMGGAWSTHSYYIMVNGQGPYWNTSGEGGSCHRVPQLSFDVPPGLVSVIAAGDVIDCGSPSQGYDVLAEVFSSCYWVNGSNTFKKHVTASGGYPQASEFSFTFNLVPRYTNTVSWNKTEIPGDGLSYATATVGAGTGSPLTLLEPALGCRLELQGDGTVRLIAGYTNGSVAVQYQSNGCDFTNIIQITPSCPTNDPFTWATSDGKINPEKLAPNGETIITPSKNFIPFGTGNWSFANGDIYDADTGSTIDAVSGSIIVGTNSGTITAKTIINGTCNYSKTFQLKGCDSCGGGVSCEVNSVDLKIGLGWSRLFGDAGYLQIKEEGPIVASPAILHYRFGASSGVEVLTNSFLRQVKAPEKLCDISLDSGNPYKFFVKTYSTTNAISEKDTNGFYIVSALTPSTVLSVENLDGDTNRVLIVSVKEGTTTTFSYTWQDTGNGKAGWMMESGGGLRRQSKMIYTSSGLRAVEETVRSASTTNIVFSKTEMFMKLSDGRERLATEILGPIGGAQTRTNTYLYNAAGHLQQQNSWDGSWEYFVFETTNSDRVLKQYRPFANSALPDDKTTLDSTMCRRTEYQYGTNAIAGAGDDGHLAPALARCTIEYIGAAEVARSYFVMPNPWEIHRIQCTRIGAAFNDPKDLLTIEKYYPVGFHQNNLKSVLRPDGVMEMYLYSDVDQSVGATNWTETHLVGAPNTNQTDILDGTKTVSVYQSGRLIEQMQSDIASGIVISDEHYTYDDSGRRTITTYMDGTTASNAYSCCNLDSTTARDGTITSYTYDALKRVESVTVNGVSEISRYDANNNLVSITRSGSDGSEMLTSSNVIDTLGNQVSSMVQGSSTIFSNYFSSGVLIRKSTYADGGTRIEKLNRDGSIQSVTGSAVYGVAYEYGVTNESGINAQYQKETKLDLAAQPTSEWRMNLTDMLGRNYETIVMHHPRWAYETRRFDAQGHLESSTDPDGVMTNFRYNSKGEQEYTSLGYWHTSGSIDFAHDVISRTVHDYYTNQFSTAVSRTRRYVWENDTTGRLESSTETSINGLMSWYYMWDGTNALVSSNRVIYGGYGYVTNLSFASDGSRSVAISQGGRRISFVSSDAGGLVVEQKAFEYDTHGRQYRTVDLKGDAEVLYYNDIDQLRKSVVQASATTEGQETSYQYDLMGRVAVTTLPDGGVVSNRFSARGELVFQNGSRVYPVGYGYDYAGRVQAMTNWAAYPSVGMRVTKWQYDSQGLLFHKIFPGDVHQRFYEYSPAGRLEYVYQGGASIDESNLDIVYDHDWFGRVSYAYGTNSYSEFNYDRLSHLTNIYQWNDDTLRELNVVRSFGTHGQLVSESYSGDYLNNVCVTNVYDAERRRTVLAAPGVASTFGYGGASRLLSVTNGDYIANYQYLTNTMRVGSVTHKWLGEPRAVEDREYDGFYRLTNITTTLNGTVKARSGYHYNDANQRTQRTDVDGSYWNYAYDGHGQVTSGAKHFDAGSLVPGQQFTYKFDDIGNRQFADFGGDEYGANLHRSSYQANLLNQYSQRNIPGFVSLIGKAHEDATVTINQHSVFRRGEYFQGELAISNNVGRAYVSVTNLAVLKNGTNDDIGRETKGMAFVRKNPETFTYDVDGNLTSDGWWTNSWDIDGHLLRSETLPGIPSIYAKRIDFAYDWMGRRIEKLVSTNNGSGFFGQSTNRFVYDGWNLIAVYDDSNNILLSFSWGTDLSGTFQGAGGVGGLLAMTVHTGTFSGTYSYVYDGNANVVNLIKLSDVTIAATYEYGPFGEVIRATGPLATINPFRFSTKYTDDETDLVYYGYRYYNPSTGRWLSRDPIEEQGGLNLYGFVGNDGVNNVDTDGRQVFFTPQISTWVRPAIEIGVETAPKFGEIGLPNFKIPPNLFNPKPQYGPVGPGLLPPVPGPIAPDGTPQPQSEQEPDTTKPQTGTIGEDNLSGYYYRSMTGLFNPDLGESKKTLGVKWGLPGTPFIDISVTIGQHGIKYVKPSGEGMSVSPDSAYNLLKFLRPPAWGGTGPDKMKVWRIRKIIIYGSPDLVYQRDTATHGLISPRHCMTYDRYKQALENTQGSWEHVTPYPPR